MSAFESEIVAKFTFTAEEDGEVSLSEGERVKLTIDDFRHHEMQTASIL